MFRWATTQIAPIAMRAAGGWRGCTVRYRRVDSHQANLRIVEAIAKKLAPKGARDDMIVADGHRYSGNTSSASIPLALDRMRAAGTVKRGTRARRRFRGGAVLCGTGLLCP